MNSNIRNVAIIAHVDHGKTTLVDALLRQSETLTLKEGQQNLIMDSNELERERGITIFSKNAAIHYQGHKINIVDTPGHADFGGEVERIMSMVQGVLLLVDAKDGPMPQTKFVLKKALQVGHRVILVINKIDVPNARINWVLDQTFDLFIDLGATDAQADFPVLYASAIQGKAGMDSNLATMTSINPVFDAVLQYVPAPKVIADAPLQMLVVNVAFDEFKGPLAIGPIVSGEIHSGQKIAQIKTNGITVSGRVASVMTFAGLRRIEVKEGSAGDIMAVAGIETVKIGETLADADNPIALPVIEIDKPTVKMNFSVNTSPFAGTEGEFSTARHLKDRLEREILNDVALQVSSNESEGSFTVSGRGELHISILIEKMLREGFEFQVGKPYVIYKEEAGQKLEPFEDVYIECPAKSVGAVIEQLGRRQAELKDMNNDDRVSKMHFFISTRGLIGYRSIFIAATHGEGIMNALFSGYFPILSNIASDEHGSLIAHEPGQSTAYGLLQAQNRGKMFIGPGEKVYEGMIVGEHARSTDLVVNICKEKKLTNMRQSFSDVSEVFHTPRKLTLEEAIEYLGDDELLEVTPKSLRLRKVYLSKHERKRSATKNAS